MQRKRFVKVSHKVGKVELKLTKKGLKKLYELELLDLKIEPQKIWDQKWRIVIFDIPEHLRHNRKLFQEKLKSMGFYMLQKSVWVCPYPCDEQVTTLKNAYSLGLFVSIIIAQEINTKIDLLKQFNLSGAIAPLKFR